jgi:hypothetical protein
MPRNNQGRLDNKPEAGADAPNQDVNSLLNFVNPTEFVELPTRGRFYPKNHPLHNAESIEIKYMTAKETDILTSKTLLKQGVAIDRMLQNLIVDKSIKVQDLYAGDKNAIMVAARISGFGAEYGANVACRSCGAQTQVDFDLSDISVKEGKDSVSFTEDGTFFIELPVTKVTVECKLISGADESVMRRKLEKKQKMKLGESLLTDLLKTVIVSLNGVTERGVVEEFIDVMPAKDSNFLKKEYEEVKPDIDLKYHLTCESCGAENEINLPFSTNFFWPE